MLFINLKSTNPTSKPKEVIIKPINTKFNTKTIKLYKKQSN